MNKFFSKKIKNDITLLVTFYFLLKNKSVSNAATELYIGQSAVSHQLAKLRAIFKDEMHLCNIISYIFDIEPIQNSVVIDIFTSYRHCVIDLNDGRIDFFIGDLRSTSKQINSRHLFDEPFFCCKC